jgi:hypothetical protein
MQLLDNLYHITCHVRHEDQSTLNLVELDKSSTLLKQTIGDYMYVRLRGILVEEQHIAMDSTLQYAHTLSRDHCSSALLNCQIQYNGYILLNQPYIVRV